jgi:hypothetical protein
MNDANLKMLRPLALPILGLLLFLSGCDTPDKAQVKPTTWYVEGEGGWKLDDKPLPAPRPGTEIGPVDQTRQNATNVTIRNTGTCRIDYPAKERNNPERGIRCALIPEMNCPTGCKVFSSPRKADSKTDKWKWENGDPNVPLKPKEDRVYACFCTF